MGQEGVSRDMKKWWKQFWTQEDGIGTVEMILILVEILPP